MKNNFDKDIELEQKEEIIVTKRNNIIFRITPERQKLLKEAEQFFDMLPLGSTIGNEEDEKN